VRVSRFSFVDYKHKLLLRATRIFLFSKFYFPNPS
jgi:hypothetical protein